MHDNIYGDWDTKSCSEPQQILTSIAGFDVIVVFMVECQYLSRVAGITIQLQSTTLDIIQALTRWSITSTIVYERQ